MKLKSLKSFQEENKNSELEVTALSILKGGRSQSSSDEDYCTQGGSDCYTITYYDDGTMHVGAMQYGSF